MSSTGSMKKPSKKSRPLRDVHADATRAALVAAARKRFVKNGYADTSIDEVAAAAHSTKGAVYHHFRDKKALFTVVYEEVAREFIETIAKQETEPHLAVQVAIQAFLRQAQNLGYRRVLFQDGPVVLGGTECRAIDARYALGHLIELVHLSAPPLLIETIGADIIARLILALIIEAGQIIEGATDQALITRKIEFIFTSVFAALGANSQ